MLHGADSTTDTADAATANADAAADAATDAGADAVRLRRDELHVRPQGGRGLHDEVDLHGLLHHADAAAPAAAGTADAAAHAAADAAADEAADAAASDAAADAANAADSRGLQLHGDQGAVLPRHGRHTVAGRV